MHIDELPLATHHRSFLERLIMVCTNDPRVQAALLGGSYAKRTSDEYSDLDLSVIVADEVYEEFYASRAAFLGELGELVFLAHFNLPYIAFTMYADGTEAELIFASPSRLDQIQCGPFVTLIDKQGILVDAQFPPPDSTPEEQREELQHQIACFWHDFSHFLTAMSRGQLWWAYGQLEELRRLCMNLMRFQYDMAGEICEHEKIDGLLSSAVLAPLAASCVQMEHDSILRAGRSLVACYQQLAIPLAAEHGLYYSTVLEQSMLKRLARLEDAA